MATDDNFEVRLEAELLTLRKRDIDLSKKEADLNQEIEQVRRTRAIVGARGTELVRALNIYRDVMGRRAPETEGLFDGSPNAPEQVNGAALGSIADLSHQIMVEHGGRMRVTDLVRELSRIGKLRGSSRNDYGTVHGTLKRDRRFVFTGKGEYALAPSGPERPS